MQQAGQLRVLWEAAQGLKAAVVSMAALHKNDGVRLNAAKFIEQAALLLTAEAMPAVRGISQGPIQLQSGNQVASMRSQLVAAAAMAAFAGTVAVARVWCDCLCTRAGWHGRALLPGLPLTGWQFERTPSCVKMNGLPIAILIRVR